LPAWNDWGTLFLDGLKLLGAVIIYMLPALILDIGGYALLMALDLSMGFSAALLAQSSANAFPLVMIANIFGMVAGMAVKMLGIALAWSPSLSYHRHLEACLPRGNLRRPSTSGKGGRY
jgi:hypothetical protein